MSALVYEKRGRISYITLNRPEVLNAIDSEVWNGLIEAWRNVADDSDVRVAIVTGTGDRAFSAGQDLKELAEWMVIPEERRSSSPVPDVTPILGLEVWKPFIAAINGICNGAGLLLAMSCDIRIAADNARLGLTEVAQGLIPTMRSTLKLPRLVPFGRAVEMLITGDFIDAQEAYRIGLVNKVVPFGELMPAAETLANRICDNAPLAVRSTKELTYRGMEMGSTDWLRLEHEMEQRIYRSEAFKEGPQAFVEKRKPVYGAE